MALAHVEELVHKTLYLLCLLCQSVNSFKLQVDVDGFESEMKAQRQRSKDSAKAVDLEVGGVLAGLASDLEATVFSGYHDLEGTSQVVAILKDGDSVQSVNEGALTGS